jgi:hypothetical protein
MPVDVLDLSPFCLFASKGPCGEIKVQGFQREGSACLSMDMCVSEDRVPQRLNHNPLNYSIYIYMYMAVDLKVLVRRFNCESRTCYVGNPRESFFPSLRKIFFIRESFAKVGYYESLLIIVYITAC